MDKRKFLFVSLSSLIGDIAWQVLKEGHDVRYYIDNEKERDIADGFVEKSSDWEKTPSGPTSSSSTILWARELKPRPCAPPASRSLAALPTPIILKTIAPSVRKNSRRPVSPSYLTRNSMLSIPPSNL